MLTVEAQIWRMSYTWPNFVVLHATDSWVSWAGEIRPLCRAYRVRIVFHLGTGFVGPAILPSNPRVTVERPLVHERVQSPSVPIPHHYPNPLCREQPVLCLFDPLVHEWSLDDAIADTTVPWTINWIACYEGWLATGHWAGGGRHDGA